MPSGFTQAVIVRMLVEAGADPRKMIGPNLSERLVDLVLRNKDKAILQDVLEFFKQFA